MTKLKMINFAANSFVYTKSFTLENLPAMDKILIGQGSMNGKTLLTDASLVMNSGAA